MPTIILSDGTQIGAPESDIEALVREGMLEVIERDEKGRIVKARITEAAREYVKQMEEQKDK